MTQCDGSDGEECPLLETRLNATVDLPPSSAALGLYLDPSRAADPNTQRELYAERLQAVWSGGTTTVGDALAVVPTIGEPLAVATLRSARAAIGTALDFTHVVPVPVDVPWYPDAQREAYELGAAILAMADGSLIVFDAILGTFSAWHQWNDAASSPSQVSRGDAWRIRPPVLSGICIPAGTRAGALRFGVPLPTDVVER